MCQGPGWGPAALVVATACTADSLVFIKQRCNSLGLHCHAQQDQNLATAKMQVVLQGPLIVVSLAV